MKSLSRLFQPAAELTTALNGRSGRIDSADDDEILGLLGRHPCTVDQVRKAFNMPGRAAAERIASLLRHGRIAKQRVGKDVFFTTHERP